MTENLNDIINQFENTLERSQKLASQTNRLNKLQTKQIGFSLIL